MKKKEEKDKVTITTTDDAEEMFKQIVENSDYGSIMVSFEATDMSDSKKAACMVSERLPKISTNFQHASLFNAIFNYVGKFIDDIETLDEFSDKMAPLDEIRTGGVMLSIKLLNKARSLAKEAGIDGIDVEEDEEDE